MLDLAAIALAASMVVGQADAPTSSYDNLKELGDDFVGRWVGEATLVEDMPGVGEKGEKTFGHSEVRWILDKNAIEANWNAGKMAAKWIAVWDAGSKQIRIYGVDTTGGIAVSQMSKNGNTWTWRTTGVSGDGKNTSQTELMTISDGGNTHTYLITDRVIGDEKLPNFKAVWKRLSK